jgi:hypothetical protein
LTHAMQASIFVFFATLRLASDPSWLLYVYVSALLRSPRPALLLRRQ